MAKRRRTKLSGAARAQHPSTLSSLDGDALVQVLLAAKTARTLGQLASSSKQLCSFARSRVPVCLRVVSKEEAGLVIRSHACGRPPFSGCTGLNLYVNSSVMYCLSAGVLHAAQQWTGLQRLDLALQNPWGECEQALEYCASNLLIGVPALTRLRRLVLYTHVLGACCLQHIQQLTQLTYLQLTAQSTPTHAAADLVALSRLTNLVELHLNWALAPHLPASPEGPFCLPSSLVKLELCSLGHVSAAPMACWVAHLPGCSDLQHLQLSYGPIQHASTHPSVLVRQLAQHHPQLRSLDVSDDSDIYWCAPVAGLPAAAAPGAMSWRPDAALAALTGLKDLRGGDLVVEGQADWQHLAQLTALQELSGVCVSSVPGLGAGITLTVLVLEDCTMKLGGYDLGRLLLACPLLERANVAVQAPAAAAAGARLPPHPNLQDIVLNTCNNWGDSAAAAAHWGHLAPVLCSVPDVDISHWPKGSNREDVVMPDLSPCTALTSLTFDGGGEAGPPLEQEALLSMVAPLAQLQRLQLIDFPRVNARVALALQSMLPQLQKVDLEDCGCLLPPMAEASGSDEDGEESRQEVRARQAVLRLLRRGLVVNVY